VRRIADERRGRRPPKKKVNKPNAIIKVIKFCMNGIGSASTDAKKTRRVMLASICLLRCCSL